MCVIYDSLSLSHTHTGSLSYLQKSEERVKRGAGVRGEASRFRHQMDFSKIADKKKNPEEVEVSLSLSFSFFLSLSFSYSLSLSLSFTRTRTHTRVNG